jgi:ABC-type multidrug transport system fused ATPase/permease subunit
MKPFSLIFSYAKKYSGTLIITSLSMLALVGVQLLIPWIIKTLVSMVTSPGVKIEELATIARLSILVFIVFIARSFLQFLRSYLAHVAGWGVVADVRKFIYEHMQRLSLRFYEDKQIGQLMSNVVNDTDLFEQLIAHAIPDIVVNLLTFFGVTAVLINLNWKLALLSMMPIPLIIFSLRIYAKYVRPAFRNRQKELGDLNAILNDNLSGIREIKSFTRETDEARKVHSRIESYRVSLLKALKLMATFQPFVDFTSSIGILIVIFYGGQLAIKGLLPVADLVAFFLYLDMFYNPVRVLSGAWEAIQSSLAGADRITDLLIEKEEPAMVEGSIEINSPIIGHIQFNDVSFEYTENHPVLEHIDLDIPFRSIVALVGPTGVGKSTLVSLIARFYDVNEGTIFLDDRNICEYTLDSLRQQISIVLQDVFLFYGNVRENIMFGNPDATEDDLIAAVKAANAYDFIMDLPDGFNTLVGERGIKLSGGQKQRISIARAILKNAPIIILDEATSSVDTETEFSIQEALERLMKGRTTLVIAHRLSTVRNANKIVVLEDKSIREMGTHEDLIKLKNGLYRRLYSAQKHLEPIDSVLPII